MRTLPALTLLLALLAAPALADDDLAAATPPPLPSEEASSEAPSSGNAYDELDEGLQPQVTITRHRTATVEEYRQGGRLYMIKITPSKGRPYYLVDSDGDGSLESRRNALDNPEVIKWRIFSW
jgi:hypothetical protein